MKCGKISLPLSCIVFVLPASSQASETITYQYDELGRLIQSSKTGGPATGTQTSTAYDPAGNRTNQLVSGSTVPPPPPPPPTSNQPPVANADNGGTMTRCSIKTVNVIANDADPESNLPLVATAVSSTQIGITLFGTTSVQFESDASTGVKSATYTVQDSLGATATGTVTITVSGGSCQ